MAALRQVIRLLFYFFFIPLLLLAAALLVTPPRRRSIAGNILYSDESLYAGEALSLGTYQLHMQPDCNLALYDAGRVVWATKTSGLGTGCRCTMQSDGRVLVYDAGDAAVWSSGRSGSKGRYVLVVQKNRNVVAYGTQRWATKTSTRVQSNGGGASPTKAINILRSGESLKKGSSLTWGPYALTMEPDCNLVLYDAGVAIWASNSAGSAKDCICFMQSNGRLVMYNVRTGAAVWSSGSRGPHGHYVLVLQKDRNVVIYGPDRWATNSSVRNVSGMLVGARRRINGTGLAAPAQHQVS